MSSLLSENPDEERPFLQRFGFVLGVAGIAVVGAVIFIGQALTQAKAAPRKAPEVTLVAIVATPPPPPPPPPPQPKLVEEKMIEQMPVDDAEAKPEEASAAPAPDLGTNVTGNGPADGFGLSRGGGGGFSLGARGGSGGSASRWGWYASQVQATIGDALRREPRTRDAAFRVVVRVWSDSAGRVTRAQLAESTGDAAVDAALQDQVLTGLQLREPPPEGMPMPIVMRLTARRPN